MNASWLIDIVLLLVLVFFAYLAVRLGRHDVVVDDDELIVLPQDVPTARFSVFPAQLIRHAGFIAEKVKSLYWSAKILLAILLPLALFDLNLAFAWSVYVLVGLLGFFAPDFWLWQRKRRRQASIERALSYFLDLTIAFLVSGMNLDGAIRQGVRFGLPPRNPLRQELNLVNREIDAGRDRTEAYASLWQRTGVVELQSVVNMMQVGFHLGSPIVGSLQNHSEMLRSRLHEKGMKRINLKTVLAMVPLVLLNFPMMGLLVFFPAVLELSKLFPLLAF